MTPNTAGAREFYSAALGWKVQPWEQDSSYVMFVAPSGPLGGSVESRDGPPNWVPYVAVADVDATVEQATGLGGRIQTASTPIGSAGRYAVLADPQGGTFGIYSSSADAGTETAPRHGEFSWHELAATDNRAVFDFYRALFAWDKISEFDMGPMGIYLVFGRNGAQLGGMFNKEDMGKAGAAYWVGYVRVQDVHETVEKVVAARGSLVNGPMEVPGGDWIAQFIDPYGALFAAHVLAVDVKPAKKAARKTKPIAAKAAQRPPRKATKKAAKKNARKKKAAKTKRSAAKKRPVARKRAAKKRSVAKKKRSAGKKRPVAKSKTRAKAAKRKKAKRR
jgi:hypothetical protein